MIEPNGKSLKKIYEEKVAEIVGVINQVRYTEKGYDFMLSKDRSVQDAVSHAGGRLGTLGSERVIKKPKPCITL